MQALFWHHPVGLNSLAYAGQPTDPDLSKMNDAYPLTPFRIGDPGLLLKVMRQWPLATLISGEIGNACISLIPVLVKDNPVGDIRLLGHLDADDERIDRFIGGIKVTRISGIAKLAQDKGVEDANIATRFLLGTTDGSAKEILELLLDSALAE